MDSIKKHVFIMGGKGYRKNYGGWETFVRSLIRNWKDEQYQFYVPEIVFDKKEQKTITIDGVICPQIYTRELGAATMVIFALKSFLQAKKSVKDKQIKNAVFYILGLRIGPFVLPMRSFTNALGIKIIINPDGMEWKRAKWNALIKAYFLLSERTMYQASDVVICDSQAIEDYVVQKYPKLKAQTRFIPYGAIIQDDRANSDALIKFYQDFEIKAQSYYLIVGRFVPENNYELIIREFMKSDTKRSLVIISNVETNAFYADLKQSTGFDADPRIKFVGTVYDQALLIKIRNNAFAYLHGHSAGGTNPSLLEAMATTDLNLLFDVVFNREVGSNATYYFSDKAGSLGQTIHTVETLSQDQIQDLGQKAKDIIRNKYTWDKVVNAHHEVFETLIHSGRTK